MSSPVRPEPDPPVPRRRAAPEEAVTEIMPVIAPWPQPGREPPRPPALSFPAGPAARGVAAVDASMAGEAAAGPVALESDSWEIGATAPFEPVPAPRPGGASRRVWIVVGAVLAALVAAVAVPFLFDSGDSGLDASAPSGDPTALDEPAQISAETSPALTITGATAATLVPSPAASGAAGSSAGGSGQRPPSTTRAANPPVFGPVTFEAENGTRTGSATVWSGYAGASGGALVRNIGNWGGTPGTLRINNVVVPTTAGYTITIYFAHPDGERSRSATMTVSGSSGVNVSFTGASNCCQTKVLTNVTISAGSHTITFANSTGHAPSIDKVVITRP